MMLVLVVGEVDGAGCGPPAGIVVRGTPLADDWTVVAVDEVGPAVPPAVVMDSVVTGEVARGTGGVVAETGGPAEGTGPVVGGRTVVEVGRLVVGTAAGRAVEVVTEATEATVESGTVATVAEPASADGVNAG